jgi:hypothetical protein
MRARRQRAMCAFGGDEAQNDERGAEWAECVRVSDRDAGGRDRAGCRGAQVEHGRVQRVEQ